jgi:hypothetical protein
VRPAQTGTAEPGFCSSPCDAHLHCSDDRSTCVEIDGGAWCFPWDCLGLGQPANPAGGPPVEPWPQLPNLGGPYLTTAQLVVVTFPGFGLTQEVNAFIQELITSGYLLTVGAEYGLQGVTFGGAVTMPNPAPSSIDDVGIQKFLATQTANGTIPPPTPNTVYVLFYPQSTVVYSDASHQSQSCKAFAAYHGPQDNPPNPLELIYSVVPDCGAQPLLLEDELQGLEVAASHEIAESISDPAYVNTPAWLLTGSSPWARTGGEDADFCVGIAVTLDDGGNQAQRIWSNTLAQQGGSPCAPVPEGGLTALFSVSYPVVGTAGTTLQIPMMAWATDGSTAVSFNAYGGSSFKDTLVPPAFMPTNGQIVPYGLRLPPTRSSMLISGKIASQDDAGAMEAWWPVAMRVEPDAG